MKILAIIPARGGSKGIPRKNIRLMAGRPLISYAIENALKSQYIDDVYVSTDDDEIAQISRGCGAETVYRNKELSADEITLDPVIYDALTKIEESSEIIYDYVITMQPTSPLLKPNSLDGAIAKIIEENYDCMISVINKPHLSWRKNVETFVPNYMERLNRQLLPENYLETGAFVISKRSIISEKSRISGNISVFEIDSDEGIDIDDKNDWFLAENLINKKRIIFRVDGNAVLGMGHIYNCITLAQSMIEHDVLFVLRNDSFAGINKIKEMNLPFRLINDNQNLNEVIEDFKPDVWVNDCLNTTKDYILYLKSKIDRVVTIEDLGSGVLYADAVINALYSDEDLRGANVYNGWRYVCLRDEFQIEKPKKFSDIVTNIMIMFGGSDPSNYTKMLYDSILAIRDRFNGIRFNFVIGLGYDIERNELKTVEEKNIYVYPNVKKVTEYMKMADLAIISQGRTIFEVASMGIPSIVLSQNEREANHKFATMRHGFINLGMKDEVDGDVLENTLNWLIKTSPVRRDMHELMLKYSLREGLARVKSIILGDAANNVR